jgi:hypothetical protein
MNLVAEYYYKNSTGRKGIQKVCLDLKEPSHRIRFS